MLLPSARRLQGKEHARLLHNRSEGKGTRDGIPFMKLLKAAGMATKSEDVVSLGYKYRSFSYDGSMPSWNSSGVLSPIDINAPHSQRRSPYAMTLGDFVGSFAFTAPRIDILRGFLAYRERLHSAGLVSGFQWLDGSFLEDVERVKGRPPGDIDVVTFFDLPGHLTQEMVRDANPGLFPQNDIERKALKSQYNVDAYVQSLSTAPPRLVKQSAYWYSMWSHRRDDFIWKGFVQVDLNPKGDVSLATELANRARAIHSLVSAIPHSSTP